MSEAQIETVPRDRYGSTEADGADYMLSSSENDGLMRIDSDDDSTDSEEDYEMTIQELLYSSSSYYAIAKPVTLTMILSALTVVFVNNDQTRAEGEQAMASAYEIWQNDSSKSGGQNLAISLANALVMVSVICAMTFVIVILYRMKFMKCLIGYMILCSGTLLGVLGGNLLRVAISIYSVPVDKLTFFFFIYNFCLVGVLSVFWGRGIPKFVTQGYLIATSVILAWHLSYFDTWTTWTLLFMLALYDLCAVLTPCGPLKALVELMSQEDSPEMPGLLFEAELPPEAKRPGVPKNQGSVSRSSSRAETPQSKASEKPPVPNPEPGVDGGTQTPSDAKKDEEGPIVNIPLAIAKVYSLEVIAVPTSSKHVLFPHRYEDPHVANAPLLQGGGSDDNSTINLPEHPTAKQLRAVVTVRLPVHGGRLEHVSRRGKKVYLEKDRHGNAKRLLWVDRNGKVFAEMRDDDEDGPERNSIRLGLGDFIFYFVLVAKAAQYSFSTFIACMLVILAGLGGTLVLLSVYHQALPALPISIFLGVLFYLVTRAFIEPWIEAVLSKPLYV